MASLLEFLSQPIKQIQDEQSHPYVPLQQYQNPNYRAAPQGPVRATVPAPRNLPDNMSLDQMLSEAATPQGINPLEESIKAVMMAQKLSPYIRNPNLLGPTKIEAPVQGSNPVQRGIDAASHGWWRGAGGVVSDLSGLADLLSPGTGTSEFTKQANKLNESTDKYVAANRLPDPLYKGGQVGANVAAFLAPGEALGALGKTSKLAEIGANVAADTAQGAGFRAARGQDVNAGNLAVDAATSLGTAGLIHGAGAAAKKLPAGVKAITDEFKQPDVPVVKTVLKEKDTAAQKAQTFINKVEQKAANEGRNTTTYEEVKIAQKLRAAGIDPATVLMPKKNPSYAPTDPSKFSRVWQSVNGVISQYGDVGKDISARIKGTRDIVETKSAQLFRSIPSVQKLDKAQFTEFVDALNTMSKGKRATVSAPEIKQAIKEWQGATKQILGEARDAGIKMGDLGPNYFPRIYKDIHKDKVFNRIVDNILETNPKMTREQAINQADFIKKGSVKTYGNLEKSRGKIDVPGYEKNHGAVVDYVNNAYDRIARAKMFGANDEVLTKARATLQKQGYNVSKRADDPSVFSRYVGIGRGDVNKNTTGFKASALARKVNAWTSLSAAGISNATQLINTASVAGTGKTLKAAVKTITSPEAKDFAAKTGVDLDHAIASLTEEQLGSSGKITRNIASPFFQKIEKFNRDVTAIVGADFGDKLAQKAAAGDETAARLLRDKLGVTGKVGASLTDSQKVQAARKLTEISQFKVDPMDMPGWVETPLGKLAMQFRSFGYKQTGFVYNEVLREFTKGNVAPLIRFVTLGVPAGLGANTVRDKIRFKGFGQDKPEDTTPKSQQVAADIAQGLSQVGGFGLPGSIAQSLYQGVKYGDPVGAAASAAGGPTVGLGIETANNIYKAEQGNTKPLAKEGVRKIPAVGPSAANLLSAPKLPDWAGGGKGPLASKPQKPNPSDGSSTKPIDPRSEQAKVDSEAEKTRLEAKAGDGYQLTRLPNGKYAYTLEGDTTVHVTTDLKAANKAVREDAFGKSSDNLKQVGDIVLRKDASGKVVPTTKTKYEYSIGTQELEKFKRNDDLESWTKTANKQLDSIAKQLTDPNIDPLDAITLQNDADALKKNLDKYTGYGGFNKGKGSGSGRGRGGGGAKKASLPKLNLNTAGSSKAPSIPKIAIKNMPTYKSSAKVKKLSIKKIPTTYKKKMI